MLILDTRDGSRTERHNNGCSKVNPKPSKAGTGRTEPLKSLQVKSKTLRMNAPNSRWW
jgi:hypothetical protein